MKKSLLLPLLLLFISFTSCRSIEERRGFSVQDVPNPHLQNAYQFISDPKDYINERDEAVLNQMIFQISQTADVEIAVVLLPHINRVKYANEREFANLLFEAWGIGKKGTDRGLLILQTIEGRNYTFEVGYGLEGELTDAQCKMIQVKRMIPYAKEGQYSLALKAGLESVQSILKGSAESRVIPPIQKEKEKKGKGGFGFLGGLLLLAIIVIILITQGPSGLMYILLLLFSGGRRGGGGMGSSGGSWGGGSSGGGGASSSY